MDGKELRKWRTYMGWSQEQAGKAFGKTRRAYQELESTGHEIDRSVSAHAMLIAAVREGAEPIPAFLRAPIEATIAEVDAMPKAGRPKKDLLEELHTLVKKHRKTLVEGAKSIGGTDVRKSVGEILTILDVIDEAAGIEQDGQDEFDKILG